MTRIKQNSCPVSESFWHYCHNMVHLWCSCARNSASDCQQSSAGSASTKIQRRKDCAASWVCLGFSIRFVSKQCPLWNDQLSQTRLLTYANRNCSMGVLLSSDFSILPQHGFNALGDNHSAFACVAAQLRINIVLQNWRDGHQSFIKS